MSVERRASRSVSCQHAKHGAHGIAPCHEPCGIAHTERVHFPHLETISYQAATGFHFRFWVGTGSEKNESWAALQLENGRELSDETQ